MTKDRDNLSDAALEALFQDARHAPPQPLPATFEARLVSDALAYQSARIVRARPGQRRGVWAGLRDLLEDLGGTRGLAGLTTAGIAGLWIGIADPLPVTGLSTLFLEGATGVSPALAGLVDDLATASPFDDFTMID